MFGVEKIEWPALSTNLNLIEHLMKWNKQGFCKIASWLKRILLWLNGHRFPQTYPNILWNTFLEEWKLLKPQGRGGGNSAHGFGMWCSKTCVSVMVRWPHKSGLNLYNCQNGIYQIRNKAQTHTATSDIAVQHEYCRHPEGSAAKTGYKAAVGSYTWGCFQ